MICEKHPQRDSVAKCQFCGKELCEECAINIAGKNYCEECMSELVGPELTNIANNRSGAENNPTQTNINNENDQAPVEVEKPQDSYDDLYSDDRLYNDTREEKPITPNKEVEDKYEKYLDDLYFDEKPQTEAIPKNDQFKSQKELSLSEQLAMDEAENGSITKEPFIQEEVVENQNSFEENNEKNRNVPIMENLRKNANIHQNNTNSEYTPSSLHRRSIHYKKEDEKKPFSSTETILTIILILLIIFVVIYIVYLLTLHNQYPNILDAILSLF